MAKVLNPSFKIWYGLTVHIIRFQNLQAKFFNFSKFSHQVKIPANYTDSTQFAHTVRELHETCTFC